MIICQENNQLTKAGRGTLMGNLLRQCWHPIASPSQLDQAQAFADGDEPIKALRGLAAN